MRTRAGRASSAAKEAGQMALIVVIAIMLLLVTSGAILAANAVNHDPLVQADAVEHYAYRALQAGINSYLNTINSQPNLVNCSTASTSKTCTNTSTGIKYDTWTQVPDTTSSADNVPEYYLWTNPQLCFSQKKTVDTACATPTTTPTKTKGIKGNFEYLQVLIIGAAGYPGRFQYQSSVVSFAAASGFLTHLWWSNYEAIDPGLSGTPTTKCHYDWYGTKYSGSDGTCTPVYFGPGDVIDGPVFANDSIYAATKPVFGTPTTASLSSPVTTADPHCLFVDPTDGTHGSKTHCKTANTADVSRYTATNSHYGAPVEPIPTSDTALEKIAALNGCVYTGPTLISFYATKTNKVGYMDVTSKETGSGSSDPDNDPTNTHTCLGTKIPIPSPQNTGNGVIFVANASGSCSGNGDSPWDGIRQGKATQKKPTTIKAQITYPNQFNGTGGFNYVDGEVAKTDDCEGDVFIRDTDSATTPTGTVAGISGNLTVAAQNNIIITGNLEYTDCGSSFNYKRTCTYNTGAGAVNDSLGLIATNYVEVNHPANPSCKATTTTHNTNNGGGYTHGGGGGTHARHGRDLQKKTTKKTPTISCKTVPTSLLSDCSATVSALTAVLCNPGPTVYIDAAILALHHSFLVNNYTIGPATKKLYIYGSLDQDWRGPVGTFSGGSIVSGYSKYYIWDSRLQYVSIPHYLQPGTPSWALSSSSVVLTNTCPGWPKPYPTGSVLTPKNLTANKVLPQATTKGPTGASGAC